MRDQITDDLDGRRKLSLARATSTVRTCSAVIPFASAFLTLSRVICPTTRLGNRDFKVTNRLSTAICNGLSASNCHFKDTMKMSYKHTRVRVEAIVGLEHDEPLSLRAVPCPRGCGKRR